MRLYCENAEKRLRSADPRMRTLSLISTSTPTSKNCQYTKLYNTSPHLERDLSADRGNEDSDLVPLVIDFIQAPAMYGETDSHEKKQHEANRTFVVGERYLSNPCSSLNAKQWAGSTSEASSLPRTEHASPTHGSRNPANGDCHWSDRGVKLNLKPQLGPLHTSVSNGTCLYCGVTVATPK